MSDNPDAVLKNAQRGLDSAGGAERSELEIPNLVAQVGPEKARRSFRARRWVSPKSALLEFQ